MDLQARWDALELRMTELRPEAVAKPRGIELQVPNFGGMETRVYQDPENKGWWICNYEGTEVTFFGINAEQAARDLAASLSADTDQIRATSDAVSQFVRHSALWPIYNCRKNRALMTKALLTIHPVTIETIVEVFIKMIEDGVIRPKSETED